MIRIEHKITQEGIFTAGGKIALDQHSQYEDIIDRHQTNDFPSYSRDYALQRKIDETEIENYRFAYKSIHQFCTALTHEEIQEFFTLGFKIFYIEATEFIESPFQIVFKPESVTKKKNISHLFL